MNKQLQLSSAENISNFVIFKIDKSKVNSERRFYQKITDIYSISTDYDIEFEKYRVIQDKEYLSDFDRLLLKMEIK